MTFAAPANYSMRTNSTHGSAWFVKVQPTREVPRTSIERSAPEVDGAIEPQDETQAGHFDVWIGSWAKTLECLAVGESYYCFVLTGHEIQFGDHENNLRSRRW